MIQITLIQTNITIIMIQNHINTDKLHNHYIQITIIHTNITIIMTKQINTDKHHNHYDTNHNNTDKHHNHYDKAN